jgi:excisionase family DNA binding protein
MAERRPPELVSEPIRRRLTTMAGQPARRSRAVPPGVSIKWVSVDQGQTASPPSSDAGRRADPRPRMAGGNEERAAGTASDLTPAGAAVELGCSRTLIYRLIERGELPGTYELPGSKRKRIPPADILKLKERQRVRARTQPPVYEPVIASTKGRASGRFARELETIERDEAA